MAEPAHETPHRTTRLLIPLDAEAAMRALMDFSHSGQGELLGERRETRPMADAA